MAYISTNKRGDYYNSYAEKPTTSGTIGGTIGSSTTTGTPTSGSNWVNLNKYLEANHAAANAMAQNDLKDTKVDNVSGKNEDTFQEAERSMLGQVKDKRDVSSIINHEMTADPRWTSIAAKFGLSKGDFEGYKQANDSMQFQDPTNTYNTRIDSIVNDSSKPLQNMSDNLASAYQTKGSGFGALDAFLAMGSDSGKAKQAELKAQADRNKALGDTTKQRLGYSVNINKGKFDEYDNLFANQYNKYKK